MNTALTAARTVHHVCLAVWIGGLVTLGAIVAPAAFHGAGLDTHHAGAVVGASLTRFQPLALAAGVVLLACQAFEALGASSRASRRLAAARSAVTVVTLGLFLYLGGVLRPAMDAMQAARATDRFAAAHRAYEQITGIQLLLALVIAGLTARIEISGTVRSASAGPMAPSAVHDSTNR